MTNIPYIHSVLLALDFDCVCIYQFSQLLYEKYDQEIFQPLKIIIPRSDYGHILKIWFPNHEELATLANQQFFEFMRRKVLQLNGFKIASNGNLQ
jgi:hypothetical protein